MDPIELVLAPTAGRTVFNRQSNNYHWGDSVKLELSVDTPPLMEPDTYTQQEVEQILNSAMVRQGRNREFTQLQLQEMAAELGVSDDNLDLALSEWRSQQHQIRDRQAFNTFRRKQLRQKAIRFAIVNGFLMSLDFDTHGGLSWSLLPLLGWGLSLALSAQSTFQAEGPKYERALQKWQRQNLRNVLP
jgi:hypothetical protein